MSPARPRRQQAMETTEAAPAASKTDLNARIDRLEAAVAQLAKPGRGSLVGGTDMFRRQDKNDLADLMDDHYGDTGGPNG